MMFQGRYRSIRLSFWYVTGRRIVLRITLFAAFLVVNTPLSAIASDFRELDAAFSKSVRLSSSDRSYYEDRLKELASTYGLLAESTLFPGLNVRQTIAQALDQIAKSSFGRLVNEGSPPHPDALQDLSNLLSTLRTLEETEAKSGPLNDVMSIRERVFSTFVDPLVARPGRKDLKALADPLDGILLVQFLGETAEGGIRVLDLYARPEIAGLSWSLKTFTAPFDSLKRTADRAYFADYPPRQDGKLALYIDVGPFGKRLRKGLFSRISELQRANLVVILDDSSARLDACVETVIERTRRSVLEDRAKEGRESSGRIAERLRAETSPDPDGTSPTAEETAAIRQQCQVRLQRSALDNRVVLFDPKRNLEVTSFQSTPNSSSELEALLVKAQYAVKRWP